MFPVGLITDIAAYLRKLYWLGLAIAREGGFTKAAIGGGSGVLGTSLEQVIGV